jgi:hypothetical protein
MPILGIIASSRLAAVGDFESIATVTVGGGGSANVEFTSIPAHIAIYSCVGWLAQVEPQECWCYAMLNSIMVIQVQRITLTTRYDGTGR